MTIIFGGIDFPVFEMLFLISIIMLVGLVLLVIGIVFILKELKALKSLFKEEEFDVKELEHDILNIENMQNKKASPGYIENSVKSSLAKGYKWENIKNTLAQHGFGQKYIDQLKAKIGQK